MGFRQVEMFAGIACASMPGMHKFFGHFDIRTDSMKSLLHYNFSHYFKSSTRTKIPDLPRSGDESTTYGHASSAHPYELKNITRQDELAVTDRPDESRIHLTREISVFAEDPNDLNTTSL